MPTLEAPILPEEAPAAAGASVIRTARRADRADRIDLRQIIMGPESIHAIQEGRKTQTRRVCKYQPTWVSENEHTADAPDGTPGLWSLMWWDSHGEPLHAIEREFEPIERDLLRLCPYGKSGTRLWVRETWSVDAKYDGVRPSRLDDAALATICYHADGKRATGKKRPAMFLPRRASRFLLEVTGVRVERLQAISEADALAEGIMWQGADGQSYRPPVDTMEVTSLRIAAQQYEKLWDAINGRRYACSWDDDPWVYVVVFRLMEAMEVGEGT